MDSLLDRFWNKVDKKGYGDCWNWTGAISKNGYGHMGYPDRYTTVGAHRVSWMIHNGAIPDGKYILHKCDNRACVNPNHIYAGTQGDNMCDREDRNRSGNVGRPKRIFLNMYEIIELKKSGKTHIEIANILNVSCWSIQQALNNSTLYNKRVILVKNTQRGQ